MLSQFCMDPSCGKNTTSKYYPLVTVVPLQQFLSTPRDEFPNVVCDYRAPDNCNPNNQPVPCCQRPEVLGSTPTVGTASGAMVVSSLLLMAAMSLVTLLL